MDAGLTELQDSFQNLKVISYQFQFGFMVVMKRPLRSNNNWIAKYDIVCEADWQYRDPDSIPDMGNKNFWSLGVTLSTVEKGFLSANIWSELYQNISKGFIGLNPGIAKKTRIPYSC